MIPLSDENKGREVPYVTYVIIALNVLVFLAELLHVRAVQYWSMVPLSVIHDVRVKLAMGPDGHLLVNQYGQLVAQTLPGIGPHPQWLTIFTSMFMHGGFLHIIGNMWFLWIFGDNLENVLGHVKYAVFYILCGVAAAVAHILSNPNSPIPTVGASGAIAGVLGAYLLLFPGNRVRTLLWIYFFVEVIDVPAVFFLALWFIGQITGVLGSYTTVGGGIAYWAHIGGFLAGMALVVLFGGWGAAKRQRGYRPPRGGRLSRWEE